MDKKVFELDFYGRKIVVEHGQVAKQADGAVLVRYGDTVVLSTTVSPYLTRTAPSACLATCPCSTTIFLP